MSAKTTSDGWPVATDEQLLGRYERGERGALDELFQRHRPSAYRLAYRRLRRDADAVDAVQEGFVKALRRLGSFRRQSSFKTWLLRVVERAALDLLRERERRRALGLHGARRRGPGDEQRACGLDPARSLEAAELRRLLDRAVAALPEAQRQAFVLFAEAELSYREVAAALDVPIGTVMSRLYYARRKLQASLAGQAARR